MRHLLAVGAAAIAYATVYAVSRKDPPRAVCVFDSEHSKGVSGTVLLTQRGGTTEFACDVSGLRPGKHGFHVHAAGDLRDGCASACNHYNPTGSSHGGRTGRTRHRGDLGNLEADRDGRCVQTVVAQVGVEEILGRMLIVHAGEDDLGQGGDEESRKTGNAGKRIACGVIGRL